MQNTIYSQIAKYLTEALSKLDSDGNYTEEETYKAIGPAPQIKMGHFTYPCFTLSKALKKNPAQIANELSNFLEVPGEFAEAKAVGPYINFTLSSEAYGKIVLESVLDNSFFNLKETNYPKMMIEYSQPNTHKVVHVGHLRNMCLGLAIVNINRYLKREIISSTYPGDVGTHVAKCLWYIKNHVSDELPQENKGEWLAGIYVKANQLLEDQLGTEHEDQNRKELTQVLKEIETGSGEFFNLWQETRTWSLDLMKEIYSWAGIEFDRWFYESEVDSPSLGLARKYFDEGKLIESDGAIGMDLKDDNLGFCMLIKSDGNGLYATKDIELARRKFEEFGIEKSIYIVDNRQALHFKQVFKVLENIGFRQAKDCFHLQYDVVELADGAMSSRTGNMVSAKDLIMKMEETIKSEYLSKYKDDWSQEEIDKTASIIANGAIKYGMIRVDNNRKIIFEMKEWLKLDGESGPYLQYVYARINTMCAKLGFKENQKYNWSTLNHEAEISLLHKMTFFNNIVYESAEQLKTIHMTNYLYDLGRAYNYFYAQCPIAKAESEDLKLARLALSYSCGEVIKTGLSLIGIDVPERM